MIDLASKVASSEVARDINRRIVLNLIRTRQPVSRADLARVSGLQRSTISLIVEDLLEQNWVVEGATGRLPRGRRPTYLRLNEDRVIVGIDLRPSYITIAVGNVNGKFSMQEVVPTPPDPQTGVQLILQRILPIIKANRGRIEGVGITIPGRAQGGRLAFSPNLNWADFDLARPIAKATGLNVELENAANACVLASIWFDRLGACQSMVAVTVSEGIGTGVWLNGSLAGGVNGMAGEFGHVPLDLDGPLCGCGSKGCWEMFASNRAALRYYHESAVHSGGISFPDLMSLADQGDHRARKAIDKMAYYLGRGMRMIVAGLAPERIIVIGDLTRCWQRFGPLVESEVSAQVLPGGQSPLITPVHEGGMARLRGTIAVVLQKDFGVSGQLPV